LAACYRLLTRRRKKGPVRKPLSNDCLTQRGVKKKTAKHYRRKRKGEGEGGGRNRLVTIIA